MLIALFSQYYLRVHRATWFRSELLSSVLDRNERPVQSFAELSLILSISLCLEYNYLLSAGLDGGTQFMVFVATFASESPASLARPPLAERLTRFAPVFGGAGKAATMPTWALNPDADSYNYDYCMKLT